MYLTPNCLILASLLNLKLGPRCMQELKNRINAKTMYMLFTVWLCDKKSNLIKNVIFY